MDDLDQLTDLAAAYEPCMSLCVDQDSRSVELILDTSVSTYSEWIKGEGGDICLLRCRETKRVVGVRLPLMNERLAVFHRGLLRVNDGFKRISTNPERNLPMSGYSATVSLDFEFSHNGEQHKIELSHVGSEDFVPRSEIDLDAPVQGRLVVTVDGVEDARMVHTVGRMRTGEPVKYFEVDRWR